MSSASKTRSDGPDVKRRRTFTPRPPRPAEERLPRLYAGLTDQVDGGHFENAKKTCRKILALDPSATPAFQTLLFLHLQTDDYAKALELVSSPPPSALSLEFERAYCLYRLHREEEALEMLQGVKERGRKEEHLEAQIQYRLGNYEATQQLYDDLLAGCDPSSPEYPDIITNLTATSAHTDFLTHGFHAFLSAPPPVDLGSSSVNRHVPTEAELESHVPSLPTGWASGGFVSAGEPGVATVARGGATSNTKAGGSAKIPEKKKKPRHKLPKGAVMAKPFTEDPERWLPLRQRTSYLAAQSKKKGAKESMGTGFTQGSTSSPAAPAGGGSGAGGGGKNKKGKKK